MGSYDTIVIKNGMVIDPKNNVKAVCDLLIEDGKIKEISNNINADNCKVIDAKGKWVCPGFIDMHVHLRQPGFERKETISSGTRAAVMGGFTTICAMPNTKPAVDNEIVVEFIKLRAKTDGVCNVLPIGSITKGQNGEELSDIGTMSKVGICAVSEDGKSVLNAGLMKTALKYTKMFNIPVLSHCEELSLVGKGQMNAGDRAALLGLNGISNDSEEVIVARDIILANAVKAKLHLCHISTQGSVDIIEFYKQKGADISFEVTPHHFSMSDEDIVGYDANYKMNPPLRSKKDVEYILDAFKRGVVDVIATDHAPHHVDEKNCEFEKAANGIIGLETAVGLTLTNLYHKGIINEEYFVKLLSTNPANILGIDKGSLSVGADADITIINPNEEYIVDVNSFKSKARNCPYDKMQLKGRVTDTIVGGKIIVENGTLMTN